MTMDEDLQLLYGIREEFSEVTQKYRKEQDLSNVYTFRGGISESIPASSEGSIDLEGTDETVHYTLDQVRGNPLLRMSHTFEEIDDALSEDGGF